MDLQELEQFVIDAREHTRLGQGRRPPPERAGAMEIVHREGPLTYRDSYFGGNRLIGQEIVRRAGEVVWGMNYWIIIHNVPLPGEELAAFLKRAQLARYRERRLLGPHHYQERHLVYEDQNEGTLDLFSGEIRVLHREEELFHMHYRGGRVQ